MNAINPVTDTSHDEVLRYRRQFVLGPRYLELVPSSWERLMLRDDLFLSAHPELHARRLARGGRSLTLLGYVIDPDHPDADDRAILDRLLDRIQEEDSFRDWVKHTDRLGGRWVMIADHGEELTLLHDAMGLRQVYFTDVSLTQELWCASQPGILAEALGLQLDPTAVSEFMESTAYRIWEDRVWPAAASPYREVIRLSPNNSLDLETGHADRYWPSEALGTRSLEDGARSAAELLRRLIQSASCRFELAHSISAGWDSRLVLAGSKEVAGGVHYFTLDRLENLADVTVTPRLLESLGLEDNIVVVASEMNDEFERVYRKNVTEAHELNGRFAQALSDVYPQGRVCMTGNAAEITRARFRLPAGETEITARWLARFTSFQFPDQLERITFVTKAWERWLSGLGDTYDVNPLDLFYWDHWAGNFAATNQLELDIVYDTFTPYSCRALLATMLSVDESFRDHDHPVLYEEMIRLLWPEVLDEPVNPERELGRRAMLMRRLRQHVSRALMRVGLYLPARNLYRSVKDRVRRSAPRC